MIKTTTSILIISGYGQSLAKMHRSIVKTRTALREALDRFYEKQEEYLAEREDLWIAAHWNEIPEDLRP